MTEVTKKWNDETVAQLNTIVGSESPVSGATVEKAAEALGLSVRSVAAKLRQLDFTVESMAKVKTATFTEEQSADLADFVNANAGKYTYKDIAEKFNGGEFNAKQVQGKILALELTGSVKAAEKVEAVRTYTEAEEAKFIKMVKAGSFIEEIAEALGKKVASVRGKALSLTRQGQIDGIPAQKESHAKASEDVIEALGSKVANMTLAQLVEATGKTDRGLKTLLTRRGITCADYDGAAKRAKAEAKAAA
jgi:hypothetical protein